MVTLNPVCLISEMRKGNKERKNLIDIGWENKERKKMRGIKMRITPCLGDRTRSRGEEGVL